jgi:potassium-dependent mechanosensitive channel
MTMMSNKTNPSTITNINSSRSYIRDLCYLLLFIAAQQQSIVAQEPVILNHSAATEVNFDSPESVFTSTPPPTGLQWKSLDSANAFDLVTPVSNETVEVKISPVQTASLETITKDEPKPAVTSQPSVAKEAAPAPAKPAVEAPATTANPDDKPALITLEEIQRRQASVEAQTDLAEEVKTQLLQHYQRATESLRLAADSVKKTAELKAERDNGPTTIKEIRLELEQPVAKSTLEIESPLSIADLEQSRLVDEELANENLRELEAWKVREKVRAERKPQMPALIEKTKQQLADTKKAIEAPAVEGETPNTTQARKADQEAFVILLQQQLEQYRIEQTRYEALNELFPLKRDRLMRQKNYFDKRLENWKVAITDARRIESERQALEAKQTLRNTHPALKELAQRNAILTQERKTLQDSLHLASESLKEINLKYEELSKNLQNLRDKESLGALSTGAGMLLRKQRNKLPSPGKFREKRRFATKEISRLQLELMPLEDERNNLGDIEAQLDLILSDLEPQRTLTPEEIRDMARDLLNDRSKYLGDLLGDYSKAMTAFGELEVSSGKLNDTIIDYQNFIDERVLWIRSAGVVNLNTFPRVAAGSRVIFSRKNLSVATGVLKDDLQQHKYISLLALFTAIIVLLFSQKIRKLINKLGKKTKNQLSTNLSSTLTALCLTLVVASVWPTLMWLIGWRFTSVSGNDFTLAFGTALQVTAIAFWTMEVLRQLSRKRGISETFLEWNPKSMAAVHKKLLVLMLVSLPLMFLTVISDVYNEGYWADSVGRFAFIAFCLVLVIASVSMLKPSGQILGSLLKANQDGWMYRTRNFWYPLSILAPATLAVMAIFGYQYTAEQLLVRLQFTSWLSISILIAYTLVTQWIMIVRKQMAMEQARARRAEASLNQRDDAGEQSPVPQVDKPQVDLTAINQQMRKLLRVVACVVMLSGSWMIWSQVMPALQVFNRVEIWSTTVNVVEPYQTAEGLDSLRNVPKQEWITLGDFLFAFGIVAVAVLGSKNLPGLLELSLLQRLPLDHGERNAVTTLCRYACISIGMIWAAKTIGIGWSSVQWLLAALTVGLGFGLQEIFANFVSGLIILFERPIRIGDVVTIDTVTGSVSKIQIRATTIIDWDRKEYIVPNKEFVTGRLLNWTLSDKTNRVVVNVGVAYGSDTDLALEILQRVAAENPVVLNDPPSIASFDGFGDSCLSFNLRVYLPNLDNRLRVITDLHLTIDREFRKAGIEIAFPQMDLHVRSMPTKEMKLPVIYENESEQRDDESQAA